VLRITLTIAFIAATTLAETNANAQAMAIATPIAGPTGMMTSASDHRLWVVNTRSLPDDACQAPLLQPAFKVSQLDLCKRTTPSSIDDFLNQRDPSRPVVISVHGNRMGADDAIERGIFTFQQTMAYSHGVAVDYVVFSWPADQQGILIIDGREKAERTDAEGLYLAWLCRELVDRQTPITIIGFSFGGRVATGAMHALAGGRLGGRTLPGAHRTGAEIAVGLVAPALEDGWLRPGRYHGMATQNIRQISILYNRRDAVLRRYWLIDKVRGRMAMGYTGPSGIGPRLDGSPMPLSSRDCSPTLGIHHDEKRYYTAGCRAGQQMAKLITLQDL